MRENGEGEAERKLILGSAAGAADTRPKWWWLSPRPIDGAPLLYFRISGADVAPDPQLAVIRSADTVDGITGRRTLTKVAANIPDGQGVQGRMGQAWLITASNEPLPVQVEQIKAATITLADELPTSVEISVGKPATLQWRWFQARVPSAVTADQTGLRPMRWKVAYTANLGTGVGLLPAQTYDGLVHVVPQIFAPPVDHSAIARYPSVGMVQALGHRFASFADAVQFAHGELVLWIRDRLLDAGTGRREDDLDGSAFADALKLLTIAVLVELERPEEAKLKRARAFELAQLALNSVSWYNTAGDGNGVQADLGLQAGLLAGGYFDGADPDETTFYIGRRM